MLLVLSMESAIIMTAEKKTDYTNPVKWKGRVLRCLPVNIITAGNILCRKYG